MKEKKPNERTSECVFVFRFFGKKANQTVDCVFAEKRSIIIYTLPTFINIFDMFYAWERLTARNEPKQNNKITKKREKKIIITIMPNNRIDMWPNLACDFNTLCMYIYLYKMVCNCVFSSFNQREITIHTRYVSLSKLLKFSSCCRRCCLRCRRCDCRCHVSGIVAVGIAVASIIMIIIWAIGLKSICCVA